MEIGTYNEKPFHVERESTLLIGKSVFKRVLLSKLFLDDARAGEPCVFIGKKETVEEMFPFLPRNTHLIEPSSFPTALNILHKVPEPLRAVYADVILTIIRGPADIQTTRIDKWVRVGLHALMELKRPLTDLKKILTDDDERTSVIDKLSDSEVKETLTVLHSMQAKERRDKLESTESRLLSFTLDDRIRHCIGQRTCKVRFDRPVVVSLDYATLGQNADLIASLILGKVYLDSLSGISPTVYMDGHVHILSTLLTTSVPVYFSAQSVKEDVPVIAFRTGLKDSKALNDIFQLGHGDRKLHELYDNEAYVMAGKAYKLTIEPHTHKPLKTRNDIMNFAVAQC